MRWRWQGLREHQGAQLESALRALPDWPEVIVATNLARAFTVTLEAQRRGLQLPADVDILSFASVLQDAQTVALLQQRGFARRTRSRRAGRVWSDWGRPEWTAAFEGNMLTPILLASAVLPGIIERSWGRIVSITSGSVKSPIAHLGLSNAARAGLTGFVAGTARQVARHGVIMNNLLPGSHYTDRIEALTRATAAREGTTKDEVLRRGEAANPRGRYGRPEEFGAVCAFLCSEHVGYMVGQNLLLDGGAFNATMG